MSLILSNSFNTSLGPGLSVSGEYTDTSNNTAIRVWAYSDKNIQLQLQYADNSAGSGLVNELYSVYANNNTAINSTRKKQWQRTIVTNPGDDTAERVVVKTRHIVRSNNPVITYQSDDVTLQSNIDIEGLEIALAEETSSVQVWGTSVAQSQGDHHLLLTDTSGRLIVAGIEELGGGGPLDVSTSSIQVWGSSVTQSQGNHRMLLTDASGRLQVTGIDAAEHVDVGQTSDDLILDSSGVLSNFSIIVKDPNRGSDENTWLFDVTGSYGSASEMLTALETGLNRSVSSTPLTNLSAVAQQFRCSLVDRRVKIEYLSYGDMAVDTYYATYNADNSLLTKTYIGTPDYTSGIGSVYPFPKGSGQINFEADVSARLCIGLARTRLTMNPADESMIYAVWINSTGVVNYKGPGITGTAGPYQGVFSLELSLLNGTITGLRDGNQLFSHQYLEEGIIPTLYPVVSLGGSEGATAIGEFSCDPFLSPAATQRGSVLTYQFMDSPQLATSLGFPNNATTIDGTIIATNQLSGQPIRMPLSVDQYGRTNTNLLVSGLHVSSSNPVPVTSCVDPDGNAVSLLTGTDGLITLPPIMGKYIGDAFSVTVPSSNYIVYSISGDPFVCQIPSDSYDADSLSTAIERAMNSGLTYDMTKGMQWKCNTVTESPTAWTETRQTTISFTRKSGFPSNFSSLYETTAGEVSWDQTTKTLSKVGVDNPRIRISNLHFTKGSGAITVNVGTLLGGENIRIGLVHDDDNIYEIYLDNGFYYFSTVVDGAFYSNISYQAYTDDIFGIRLDEGSLKLFISAGSTIYEVGDPIPYNYSNLYGYIYFNTPSITLEECHLDPHERPFEGVTDAFSQVQLVLEDEQTSNIIRSDLNFGTVNRVVYNSPSGNFVSDVTTINNERILNLDNDGNLVIDHSVSNIQIYGTDGIAHRPVLTDSSGRLEVVAVGEVNSILYGMSGPDSTQTVTVDSGGRIKVSTDIASPLHITSTPSTTGALIYGNNGSISVPVLTDASGRVQIGVSAEQSSVQLFGSDTNSTKRPVLVDASGKLILSGTIESSNVIYAQDADDIDTVVRVDSSGTLNTRLLLANLPVSSVNPLPNQLYGVDGSTNRAVLVDASGKLVISGLQSGTPLAVQLYGVDSNNDMVAIKVGSDGRILVGSQFGSHANVWNNATIPYPVGIAGISATFDCQSYYNFALFGEITLDNGSDATIYVRVSQDDIKYYHTGISHFINNPATGYFGPFYFVFSTPARYIQFILGGHTHPVVITATLVGK